jgi:hypothetical protein
MTVVGEDVVFRQRLGEFPFLGEAREGAQIQGLGAQGMMADAAFIAAGMDEGGVIEMGHGGLLLRCPGSASQLLNGSKLGCVRSNDNGPSLSLL